MVAKAVYALHRKLVFPSSIVMLAFNKSAAEELQARVALSLERVAIEDAKIETKTFHSLGLSIIAEATGRKPHVPEWAVENIPGFQKLVTIVDDLKDQSEDFRAEWDLFRLVLGRDIPAAGEDQLFEAWDKEGQGRLVSLNGDHVASQEERVIANWLFYNGVEYQYERFTSMTPPPSCTVNIFQTSSTLKSTSTTSTSPWTHRVRHQSISRATLRV